MIDYTKVAQNPYMYGVSPKEALDAPFSEMGYRRGARSLVKAGMIAATVDGPLPFGDAVAIAAFTTAGVLMIGYGIYGSVQDFKESRGR